MLKEVIGMDINRIKLGNSSYIMNGNHAYGIGFGALCLYFLSTPSLIQKVLKYMSEVIISRRGGGSSNIPAEAELVTQIIEGNQNWIVPLHFGNISVRIFGGGATGGGSGWMNNGEFNIKKGTAIPINIGISGSTGGTTIFGTYLSANGGSGRNGGAGYSSGIGYQFGGGGGYGYNKGGNGGMYGGGGGGGGGRGGMNGANSGGNGGKYGGGGGSGASAVGDDELGWQDGDMLRLFGGRGGEFGGGGGGGFAVSTSMHNNNGCWSLNNAKGGQYGGNGGSRNYIAENGTNTIGWSNIQKELQGAGLHYNDNYIVNIQNEDVYKLNVSGGGGYGGNAGCIHGVYYNRKANLYNISVSSTEFRAVENTANTSTWRSIAVAIPGSGGGGYGGSGGNSFIYYTTKNSSSSYSVHAGGGGGGGYGGNGASGNYGNWYDYIYGGGGGGYFSDADGMGGGGYYNYAHGGLNNSFGMGSGNKNGGAIIQYYG